ncbi:MAG: hypothetical protein ACOX3Q_05290 [Clostridia bacterium]|jgi:hypothetical protein|nr:YcxB family protein [Clostridiaceae bacterium]
MEYVFVLTEYDEATFKPQVSKALEKRTELVSRKEYPKMWNFIDKMNSKEKASEEVLKKRRRRFNVYGTLFIIAGLFLFIPSLMKPKEMLLPLLAGAFAVVLGIFYLRSGKNTKKEKVTSFDKAAIQLFNEYEKLSSEKVSVTFTDDKIQLAGNDLIDYSEINEIFITKDLFIFIWNDRITVLQKKDLSSCNIEEFISFITSKSRDSFEVVSIN